MNNQTLEQPTQPSNGMSNNSQIPQQQQQFNQNFGQPQQQSSPPQQQFNQPQQQQQQHFNQNQQQQQQFNNNQSQQQQFNQNQQQQQQNNQKGNVDFESAIQKQIKQAEEARVKALEEKANLLSPEELKQHFINSNKMAAEAHKNRFTNEVLPFIKSVYEGSDLSSDDVSTRIGLWSTSYMESGMARELLDIVFIYKDDILILSSTPMETLQSTIIVMMTKM